MRPEQEQQDLRWEDLELKTKVDGLCYVKFSTERQAKTRTGENSKNVRESKPKMFENLKNSERCPVTSYLAHEQQRPPEMTMTTLRFISLLTQKLRRQEKKWLKASQLGMNSLWVRHMRAASQLHSYRKLVNHHTRKHLVQKRVDNNIPPDEIVQITGHKNVNSLNNYSAQFPSNDNCTSRLFILWLSSTEIAKFGILLPI